jgi:hypothetical protein
MANTTVPLTLSGFMYRCLSEMELDNLFDKQKSVHVIGPDLYAQFKVTLVDSRRHKISDPGKAIEKGKDVKQAAAGASQGCSPFLKLPSTRITNMQSWVIHSIVGLFVVMGGQRHMKELPKAGSKRRLPNASSNFNASSG